VTHENNAQNGPDLPRVAELLRRERPKASPVRLDEIKRDVIRRTTRARQPRLVASLRRRVMALTLFVLLFGISTSNAAASLLKFVSGGSLGPKTLGYGNQSSGVQFFFGSFGFGGDSSDDAGEETYCPDDDKDSDDRDGSSGDNSDGNNHSDDGDGSSDDKSDTDGKDTECPSDDDGHSGSDGSDKSSDDNDKSSDDDSDKDQTKSDDRDGSSDDNSDNDTKSDDNDKSSGDNSDWSDDNDKSSDDQSD
jgi:hypothetical protein